MNDRFHIWFFLGCYTVAALSGAMLGNWLILAYVYAILTPLMVWYAWWAYRRG